MTRLYFITTRYKHPDLFKVCMVGGCIMDNLRQIHFEKQGFRSNLLCRSKTTLSFVVCLNHFPASSQFESIPTYVSLLRHFQLAIGIQITLVLSRKDYLCRLPRVYKNMRHHCWKQLREMRLWLSIFNIDSDFKLLLF